MNSMPFAWPERYRPAVVAPDSLPGPALWFLFRDGALLVSAPDPPARMPVLAQPGALGLQPLCALYLGTFDALPCFGAQVATDTPAPQGWAWQDLRRLFGVLDEPMFALAGRALQLAQWDRTNRYCGACGTATEVQTSERSRRCPSCGLTAYPRLAPAIMCLAQRTDRGRGEILLGRAPRFPRDMFSVLAGFVEPGETLEQCVEREVFEEVGVRVRNARYVASQPWPFPHSLMIAFSAEYAGGEITPDANEIEEARWFAVDALPRIPGRISIARWLIDEVVGRMR